MWLTFILWTTAALACFGNQDYNFLRILSPDLQKYGNLKKPVINNKLSEMRYPSSFNQVLLEYVNGKSHARQDSMNKIIENPSHSHPQQDRQMFNKNVHHVNNPGNIRIICNSGSTMLECYEESAPNKLGTQKSGTPLNPNKSVPKLEFIHHSQKEEPIHENMPFKNLVHSHSSRHHSAAPSGMFISADRVRKSDEVGTEEIDSNAVSTPNMDNEDVMSDLEEEQYKRQKTVPEEFQEIPVQTEKKSFDWSDYLGYDRKKRMYQDWLPKQYATSEYSTFRGVDTKISGIQEEDYSEEFF